MSDETFEMFSSMKEDMHHSICISLELKIYILLQSKMYFINHINDRFFNY